VATVLITGNPGSGKTSLARELSQLGYAALDTDQLAGWETASGTQVTQPLGATDEWLLSHRWVWSRPRLQEVIGARPPGQPSFLCGIAMNQPDLLDLFDEVFLLALDDATQRERLDTPDNAHRDAALRAQILEGRALFQHEMRDAGAVVLDGRRPTEVLAGQILGRVDGLHTSRRRGPG